MGSKLRDLISQGDLTGDYTIVYVGAVSIWNRHSVHFCEMEFDLSREMFRSSYGRKS